jgi:hypothetical protein
VSAIDNIAMLVSSSYDSAALKESLNSDTMKDALVRLSGVLFKNSVPAQTQFESFIMSMLSPDLDARKIEVILSEQNLRDEVKDVLVAAFSDLNSKAMLVELKVQVCICINKKYPDEKQHKLVENYIAMVNASDGDNLKPLDDLIDKLKNHSLARSHPSLAAVTKKLGRSDETAGDVLYKKITELRQYYDTQKKPVASNSPSSNFRRAG